MFPCDAETSSIGSALLLLRLMEDQHPQVLPGVVRVLRSSAAKLRSLSHLSETIQGILESLQLEENKVKCQQKVLTAMFHAYRMPVLEALTGDTCCNCASHACRELDSNHPAHCPASPIGALD